MVENNCECYHCAGAHPSLAIACDYVGFFVERDAQPTTAGLGESGVSGDHFPLRAGMKTFSMDGEWVSAKPLGTP
jgi:hypothetical protein